ncbi:MAG: D-alanyl-D-alanine carboxypeptidase [Firmicutes bacterium]|nr:D-alanyl-D-alanine carboxypeptidase [Bacillota bacterium]
MLLLIPRKILNRSLSALVLGGLGIMAVSGLVTLFKPQAPPPSPSLQVSVPISSGAQLQYMDEYGSGPSVRASSAMLLEAGTGTVLYAKNERHRRPIASTTKIMTALVALEREDLREKVSVSDWAAGTPGSTVRLRTGEKLGLEDLLHGLLLESGNDAAVAIAEHVAGSEYQFARLMNERAQELGAKDTRFQNPHGIDEPGHFSTAYDLALMTRTALLYPRFARMVSKKEHQATLPEGARRYFNTNQLLWSYEGAEGVKTGTTDAAGKCLVAAASRDGTRLISVVLDSSDRWGDSIALLDYGFNKFSVVDAASPGRVVALLPVHGGLDPAVSAATSESFSFVVRSLEVRNLRTRFLVSPFRAPVRKDQRLGEMAISLGGREVKRLELVALHGVPRRTPITLTLRFLQRLFAPKKTVPSGPSEVVRLTLWP